MQTSISVHIDADGVNCGLDCEYLDLFGVSPTSDEPVPRCCLCRQFLNQDNGMVLRCCNCLDMERRFVEEARRKAMREKVQNKPLAVSILEQTDYRVDLGSFANVTDMIEYLVKHERISKTYLQKELGLSQPDFQRLMDGNPFPYIVAEVQRHMGVPMPVHITAQDELERAKKSLHWSDSE